MQIVVMNNILLSAKTAYYYRVEVKSKKPNKTKYSIHFFE